MSSPSTYEDVLAARRAHTAAALSLSFKDPLMIVRGEGQFLIDHTGRRFLDAYNNVCHVGHCHPAVVRAAQEQIAVLNTNTRYLHPLHAQYTTRLAATFPPELSVVFLVNSGSEANDLALRLARKFTRARDLIVLASAYHGHTQAVIEASPYKADKKSGGFPLPPYVHKVDAPDGYRGRFRRESFEGQAPDALGGAYASLVADAVDGIRKSGGAPAAFLCESVLGCAGQVVLPEGYLRHAYAAVRAAGGLCIADEVQVGFGRVGSAMWAFELQGVVPDIVTLGKPIGNGFPMAAVVTRPHIAAAFSDLEYFNTFGGNPVSCAVGLAVLDAIESDRLRQNAAAVGDHMVALLRALSNSHAAIGDVRGLGLFVGVELVTDRVARTPATELAGRVCEHMKGAGVLLGRDGPDDNVIKIKPPLCFSHADAERLVDALGAALAACQ